MKKAVNHTLGGAGAQYDLPKSTGTDPAFVGAGAQEGLQIWRIENMKVVNYPEHMYGQFYKGDSYIVLHTSQEEDSDRKLFDIYFWLGEESSQDETTIAASKTVELDDHHLGGSAKQYRVFVGHEPASFLTIFENKYQVLQGGVASGFLHEADPGTTRLLKVHERAVAEVPCEVGAMNQSDCFILDAGKNIYLYQGPSSSLNTQSLAIRAVHQLEDKFRGRVKHAIGHDETSEEAVNFFEALGGGSFDDITA